MTAQIPEDIAKLSYEQAREELLTVVNQLETGGVALEASLALWERGEALAAHCENWLNGVSQRLVASSVALLRITSPLRAGPVRASHRRWQQASPEPRAPRPPAAARRRTNGPSTSGQRERYAMVHSGYRCG